MTRLPKVIRFLHTTCKPSIANWQFRLSSEYLASKRCGAP